MKIQTECLRKSQSFYDPEEFFTEAQLHLLQGFKSEVMKDEAGKEKMPKGKLGDQVEEWCQCSNSIFQM